LKVSKKDKNLYNYEIELLGGEHIFEKRHGVISELGKVTDHEIKRYVCYPPEFEDSFCSETKFIKRSERARDSGDIYKGAFEKFETETKKVIEKRSFNSLKEIRGILSEIPSHHRIKLNDAFGGQVPPKFLRPIVIDLKSNYF
jgi:hypothetical protein